MVGLASAAAFRHNRHIATARVSERQRSFVGRSEELGLLAGLLHDPGGAVVYIHGLAGIGKTALLDTLLARVAGAGGSTLQLDCRTVEPTERGFLDALEASDVDAFVERVATLPGTVVIALDHYEVFRLMDTWLRRVFAPALPASARLILSGRERPVAAWLSLAEFRSLPLGPLDHEAACSVLERRGIGEAEAQRLNRIARGHPLALMLASAGVDEQHELGLEEAATARVVAELARLYLEQVDDPLARRALEAASVVRRATVPLLRAMLEGDDALERLLELPFVDAGPQGLVVHEAVRDAISTFLQGTDPVRHRCYRRAAWRELRTEVSDAPPRDLWRYTADMLYLIDNPVVRDAFFPAGSQPLAVEPAQADDQAAITAIARRHDGVEGARVLEAWWGEAPESFSVVRDRDGVVVGFHSLLDMRLLRPPAVPSDPVVAAWAQHAREQPVPAGQTVLGLRRWLDSDRGELPCAVQGACWVDVKRVYMALRPTLRRMYVVVRDVPTYWPVVERLGFRPIGEGVTIDGDVYTSVALDFGPGSVDGWLAGLAAAELGLDEEPALDDAARELVVGDETVALTPLEYGLFAHLRQREGRTVSRGELLRDVWATEYIGGSNVVDGVVRSLRRKLGPAGSVVETVRGSGYRLRADWRARLS